MKDSFYSYHPAVNAVYFIAVLTMAMALMHPVCLAISLVCALTYSIYMTGRRAVLFAFRFMLPTLVLTAALNPLFNNRGATILLYFASGNPLTLESILYGAAAAVMLVTVICWFSSFNRIMTSDKLGYLLGRALPALSLIISMSLRFVPRFKAQIKNISAAQRCIGRDPGTGSVLGRAQNGLRILSVMTTWALENAVETADSMKSRGHGLRGRTAFSIYTMTRRDIIALVFIVCCSLYVAVGAAAGAVGWEYFPLAGGEGTGVYSISVMCAYFALCITPVIINVREDLLWRAMASKV